MENNTELKITKEAVLAMAKKCPTAEAVLCEGFPAAFEDRIDYESDSNHGEAFIGGIYSKWIGNDCLSMWTMHDGIYISIPKGYESYLEQHTNGNATLKIRKIK